MPDTTSGTTASTAGTEKTAAQERFDKGTVKPAKKGDPPAFEPRPEGGLPDRDTSPKKGDVETTSMDGTRVTVSRVDKDGNDASFTRGTTLEEQIEHMGDELRTLLLGTITQAMAAEVDVKGGKDGEATLTIKFSTDARAFDEKEKK